LKDLKLLGLADVVVQKRSDGTYCDRCNEEIETIGVCEICEMELRENL